MPSMIQPWDLSVCPSVTIQNTIPVYCVSTMESVITRSFLQNYCEGIRTFGHQIRNGYLCIIHIVSVFNGRGVEKFDFAQR